MLLLGKTLKVKVMNESESESESESDAYIRGKAGHMAHSLPRQLSAYIYQFSQFQEVISSD